jgi:hypothetical protein
MFSLSLDKEHVIGGLNHASIIAGSRLGWSKGPTIIGFKVIKRNRIRIRMLHHRSAFFYPHKILFEIHRVFGFFCFRILIFTDFIQSPIIFFGNVTSQIQDRLQIFQVRCPRFSVVTLNEKMCSHLPRVVCSFFMHQKQTVHLFNL